jgi:hypothetical protein
VSPAQPAFTSADPTEVNLQGNRELYMDCARVQVTGGKGGGFQAPGILIANVGAKGGGCATTYGKNTVYPSPGKVYVASDLRASLINRQRGIRRSIRRRPRSSELE